ncbi:MAG TPA: hypothetical protein VFW49_14935 [Fluviicoccus sp.]|nr:hypothetical protein [Fluviicoccus sp.]
MTAIIDELDKPAYPPEAQEPGKATISDRFRAWMHRRAVRVVQRDLEREQRLLEGLADRATRARRREQLQYGVRLAEIDAWRDRKAAECRVTIAKLKARLDSMGVEA